MAKKLEHKLEKSGSIEAGHGGVEMEADDADSTAAVVGVAEPRKETQFGDAAHEQDVQSDGHHNYHHQHQRHNGDRIAGWQRHDLTPMEEVETRDER